MNIPGLAAALAAFILGAGYLYWRIAARKKPEVDDMAVEPSNENTHPIPDEAKESRKDARIFQNPLALETLRRLSPFGSISEDELIAFASERMLETLPAGALLFRRGEPAESVFYLLGGTASIELEPGKTYELDANSAKAQYPLSRGERHTATALAQTDVQILRVPENILESYFSRQTDGVAAPSVDLTRLSVPKVLADSSLFYVFCRTFREDTLDLPALPPVALKLRQAMREEVTFEEAAKIAQMDPVIAGKLVQVANSPLYLTTKPATTCQAAIVRLGFVATRNLILGISMRQMFSAKNPRIKELMQDIWKHSVHVSALSSVLAAKTRKIDPDKALLGGLICKIGAIPFLYFAEKFPSGYYAPEEIDAALPLVQGPMGNFLLSRWDFPAEYAELPLLAEEWQYSGGSQLDLGDIVRLASWHSYVGTPKMAELPPINALPSFGKLEDGTLSPELSLNLLHEAKELVHETYKIFAQ